MYEPSKSLDERLKKMNESNSSMNKIDQQIPEEEAMRIASMLQQKQKPLDTDIIEGHDVSVELTEVEEAPKIAQQDDPLFDLQKINADSERLSKELHAKQVSQDTGFIPSVDSTDEINNIIQDIEESEASNELNAQNKSLEENATAEELIAKYEDSKLFTSYTPNEDARGPAAYIVETNEAYDEAISDTMDINSIHFNKVSGTDRNALLNRFTQSGTTVTVPLPNSGIFVEMSGAGVDELISMSSLEADTPVQRELEKLSVIVKHIVNSSIGPMSLQNFIEVVSYYDIPTLYYALFAATHPDEVELNKVCTKCDEAFYVRMNTRDLLLNYKDFTKYETDIRANVTTYKQLLANSKLSKIYKKAISNGMIIFYKHPSIKSFLNTYNHMTPDTIRKYPNTASFAFSIDKIALKDTVSKNSGNNGYVEFTDPNEIVQIISRLKNPDEKYEITEFIEGIHISAEPKYGFHVMTCPNCGGKNDEDTVSIDSLLFSVARDEDMMAGLRYRAEQEKKKKQKKIEELK